MADIEGPHLRTPATAGGGHRETHLVVDIHERQRTRGVRACTGNVRPSRPQRRKLVADTTSGFQRQTRLMHFVQDVIHRILDGSRYRAIDGGRRRLVLESTGIGSDTTRGDGTAAQRPDKALEPVLPHRLMLDVCQSTRDALVGVVHGLVDGRAIFGHKAVFLFPDIDRRILKRNRIDVARLEFHYAVHAACSPLKFIDTGHPRAARKNSSGNTTRYSTPQKLNAARAVVVRVFSRSLVTREAPPVPTQNPVAKPHTRYCVGEGRLSSHRQSVKAKSIFF